MQFSWDIPILVGDRTFVQEKKTNPKQNKTRNTQAGGIIYWRVSGEPDTALTRVEIEHLPRTKMLSPPAPLPVFYNSFSPIDQVQSSQAWFNLNHFRVQESIRLTRFLPIYFQMLEWRNLIGPALVQSAAVRWAGPELAPLRRILTFPAWECYNTAGGIWEIFPPPSTEYIKLILQEVHFYYNMLWLISNAQRDWFCHHVNLNFLQPLSKRINFALFKTYTEVFHPLSPAPHIHHLPILPSATTLAACTRDNYKHKTYYWLSAFFKRILLTMNTLLFVEYFEFLRRQMYKYVIITIITMFNIWLIVEKFFYSPSCKL